MTLAITGAPSDVDLVARFRVRRGTFRIPREFEPDSYEWARAYAQGMPEPQPGEHVTVTRRRDGDADLYTWRAVRTIVQPAQP